MAGSHDVSLNPHSSCNSTEPAIGKTRRAPVEVITDKAAAYPAMPEELLPGAWHRHAPIGTPTTTSNATTGG
jgi:hypothetical protein